MVKKWWVLASVACGTFMATLDSSIVNIALPTLTKEFGYDLYRVKWVVIVYLLVITCSLLPLGQLSDQKGRKPIFLLGYLIFILGSALCGISGDLAMLVMFRVIQAIGASMLMANGPAVITSAFSVRERGAALGILAMVVSAGLISGPSIGGFLITHLGWRSIFWVNIPIGLAGTALVHNFVKREVRGPTQLPFDWAGSIVQTLLLITIIVAFDPPRVSISGSLPTSLSRWILGAVVLTLLGLFIKIETEVSQPLVDLSLLKNRTFWTANLAGFLTFVSFSSITVLMPFFLEEWHRFPTQKVGIFMSAVPFTIFVVAPISGRLSDRFGSRGLSFAGATIGALGLFIMAGLFGEGIDHHTTHAKLIVSLCSIGLAIGLFQSPNNSAIMSSVPAERLGMASAFLATVRNLGLVIGTGLATSLFTWRMAETRDFVSSFHTALSVAGVISCGAMVASLGKKKFTEGRNRKNELEAKRKGTHSR